ncbi:hypothetical protein [Vibrio sp. THAF190c]|jgi:hypothetical protein|uniref:hypothetical protein n=1 Tax=Vibrio sp. THAF190c TaxID=2587865 RepID=UPI001268FDA1|nr:hypothetical protein [Vibrio sp. THAF190c]QFT13311.1 hypothetical protein FIV04_25510 [Vibrio sp. THAF190c]
MKTCICCQKKVVVSSESEYLAVCDKCQPWVESHNELINSQRKKLLQNLNPAAKSTFEAMSALEQDFVVLRSMDKEAA